MLELTESFSEGVPGGWQLKTKDPIENPRISGSIII